MDCDILQKNLNYFLPRLMNFEIIIGSVLILISSILILLNIKGSRPKGKFLLGFIYFIFAETVLTLIFSLFKFNGYKIPDFIVTIITNMIGVINFFIFPTIILYVMLIKTEILPIFKYLMIVGFSIIFSVFIFFGTIYFFEQGIFYKKICFGVSCSVCQNSKIDFKAILNENKK